MEEKRERKKGRKKSGIKKRSFRILLLLFFAVNAAVFSPMMAQMELSAVTAKAIMPAVATKAAVPAATVTKKTLYVGYANYQIKFKNLSAKASVTYQSANKKVATVSKSGLIRPVAKGSAVITVKMKQGGKTYTSKITVTVKKPYLSIPNKQTVLVQSSDYRLEGKAYGIAKPSFRFSSSNILVAKIDNAGMIHARAVGSTKITMTEKNSGKSVSFTLRIAKQTEKNANQIYVSTKDFSGNYSYVAPKNLSKLSKEEAALAKYLTEIQKKIQGGWSITLAEMTDYFANKPREKKTG